jgi:hypothetical protein
MSMRTATCAAGYYAGMQEDNCENDTKHLKAHGSQCHEHVTGSVACWRYRVSHMTGNIENSLIEVP